MELFISKVINQIHPGRWWLKAVTLHGKDVKHPTTGQIQTTGDVYVDCAESHLSIFKKMFLDPCGFRGNLPNGSLTEPRQWHLSESTDSMKQGLRGMSIALVAPLSASLPDGGSAKESRIRSQVSLPVLTPLPYTATQTNPGEEKERSSEPTASYDSLILYHSHDRWKNRLEASLTLTG